MICRTLDSIWLAGSGEEDFKKFSLHFSLSLLSPLGEGLPPFFNKLEFPLPKDDLYAKSGSNWPSGAGEEDF
jgi:hypothetical protein